MALAVEVEEWINYRWGLEKGRIEGEAKVLLRLLERRFGPLPDWVQERVSGATLIQLEGWAERVLDAGCLEEVFQ